MIIKGKLTTMFSKCLRTAVSLRYGTLFFLPRYACGQSKMDILASSYHSIGPAKFRRSRAVQKVLGEQLSAIETLQGKLELLRQQVKEGKEDSPVLQVYVDVYKSLQKAVASCEINNEWVYNIISWYNLTPLYRTLFQRLVRATQEELQYLVKALHAMKAHPQPIFQDLVKESVLGQLYKRIDTDIDVGMLRQLEEVLQAPLNFNKRKYYEKYLVNNLEGMLKSLNARDAGQVSELMWLFQASIKAMCDHEVMVVKLEKAILTMRLQLGKEDVERMLVAYELKGRVSQAIYEQYLKPHLLKRMEDYNDVVRTLKFLVSSQAQDSKLLHTILRKLQKMQSTSCLSPESAKTLHFYLHYLRIKGFKAPLNKSVQKELVQLCHSSGKSHNNISIFVQEKTQRKGKGQKGPMGYFSKCSTIQNSKPSTISTDEFNKLQLNIGYRLRSLNLKTASIYGKARFCCIDMEYCIHQGRGTDSELINIQSENITYALSSGRVTREVQIRDEILSHYGIKVNHVNLIQYKTRGRMCEDEYLINRRVASTPY